MAPHEPPGFTFKGLRRPSRRTMGGPTSRAGSASGRALILVAGSFGLFLLIVIAVFFVLQLS